MEIVEISLLDNDLHKDKVYKHNQISLVNLQRDSVRFKDYSNSAFYILFGPNEANRQVYIGQTSNIGRRLSEHRRAKDFWTEAIFVILNDGNLTKTDTEYLESFYIRKLIDLNYFQFMINYQIPYNTQIYSQDESRLNEYVNSINLLIEIQGCLRVHENPDFKYSQNAKSGKQIIDRVVQSYKAYAEAYEDNSYSCCDCYEDETDYFEIGNGKVIIFKGAKLNGPIPKKYKEAVENTMLMKDIVVDSLIRAKEMIGKK